MCTMVVDMFGPVAIEARNRAGAIKIRYVG